MGHSQLSETAHERFMQTVQSELDKFERKETEFLKNERKERAAELALLTGTDPDILSH